jgi:hypothetical protein
MVNASEIKTPKGLLETKDVGVQMSYYNANSKGPYERNENLMYGVDDYTY